MSAPEACHLLGAGKEAYCTKKIAEKEPYCTKTGQERKPNLPKQVREKDIYGSLSNQSSWASLPQRPARAGLAVRAVRVL